MRRVLILLALLLGAAAASAQSLTIGYLGKAGEAPSPFSPLDPPIRDAGLAGARLGIADNNTTGRFTGQSFGLAERLLAPEEDVAQAAAELAGSGARFIVANLDAASLRAAAGGGATLLNAGAPDDALRNEGCIAGVLHTIPSRAMLTDALAQYLASKKWTRWFLVVGPGEGDRLYADAVRASARKFGAAVVAEKPWTFATANARADTGHVTLGTEIPAFTRVAEHDVLVVADEANAFGEFLIGRTALPRPVAGTQGLVATAWSPVNAQWGATQLQARFEKSAGRRMTPQDYAAWLAVRAIGEAALRTRSGDPASLRAFMESPEFLVAGFKGQGQSFRAWDGQMRQPILIAGPQLLVSVSPQPGYLHRTSALDTLGTDREESRCRR